MEYVRVIWSRILQFCRCSEELSTQSYEAVNERTHLIQTNNSPALRTISDSFRDHDTFPQSLTQKDDQNALCRLVQNTAINMIDVGAMDTHNLEHQEYNDRIKVYSQRLQQQWSNIQHPSRGSTGLLKDVPTAEILLTKMIAGDDLLQIKNALTKAHAGLCDIRVEHKEAIVVPFQIL